MKKHQKTYIGSKFRTIFCTATFSMLVEYVMALTDKIIIANTLNKNALAALTLVEPFTLILAFLAFVLNGVTGVPFTAALGRGNKKKADQLISQSIFLAVVTGATVMTVYIIFTGQLLQPLTKEQEILSYIYDYFYYIRILPIPMLLNAVAYSFAIYRGGETYCNISALCSVISNIALSILLCRIMGMRGIALGTVAGAAVGLIPMVMFLFTEKGKTKFSFYLNLRELTGNMIYSFGEAMRYLYMAVLQLVVNHFLLSRFGVSAIVLFTGVTNLTGLFSAVSDGVEEFLLTMTEMYCGEENNTGCMKTMLITIKAAVVEGIVFTVVILLAAPWTSKLFGVTESGLQTNFTEAVRIYAVSAVFYEILDIYSRYYLYTNKLKNSFTLSALQNLIAPLLLSLPMGMKFGLRGVWTGLSISQMLVCLLLFIYAKQERTGKYGLFLDSDKMKREWIWNARMTKSGVEELSTNVRQILEEQEVEPLKQERLLSALKTSQDKYIENDPRAEKKLIECSLLLGNRKQEQDTRAKNVTLILKNTGIAQNLLKDEKTLQEYLQKKQQDEQKMEISYTLVNGSNRFIFKL